MEYKNVEKVIEDGKAKVKYIEVLNDGTEVEKIVPYFLPDGEVNVAAEMVLDTVAEPEEELEQSETEEEETAPTEENNEVEPATESTDEEETGEVDEDEEIMDEEETVPVTTYPIKSKKGKYVLTTIAGVLVGIGLTLGVKSCSAMPKNINLSKDDTAIEQTETTDELEPVEYVTYDEYISTVNYVKDEINNHGTNKVEDSEIASYVFIANMERMSDETIEQIKNEKLITDSAENVLQDSFQATDAINSITINATYGGTGHYLDYTQVFINEKDKKVAQWYLDNLKNARGDNAAKIVSNYYAMLNCDKENTDAPFVNNEINAGVYYILNASAGVMTLEGATSVGAIGYDVYEKFENETDMFETNNVLQTLQADCFDTITK